MISTTIWWSLPTATIRNSSRIIVGSLTISMSNFTRWIMDSLTAITIWGSILMLMSSKRMMKPKRMLIKLWEARCTQPACKRCRILKDAQPRLNTGIVSRSSMSRRSVWKRWRKNGRLKTKKLRWRKSSSGLVRNPSRARILLKQILNKRRLRPNRNIKWVLQKIKSRKLNQRVLISKEWNRNKKRKKKGIETLRSN